MNAAIILMDEKAILDWLQFKDGKIQTFREVTGCNIDNEYIKQFELVVEHPDLPEVRKGDSLMRVFPAYHFTKCGRFTRIIRVDPPKMKRKVKK